MRRLLLAACLLGCGSSSPPPPKQAPAPAREQQIAEQAEMMQLASLGGESPPPKRDPNDIPPVDLCAPNCPRAPSPSASTAPQLSPPPSGAERKGEGPKGFERIEKVVSSVPIPDLDKSVDGLRAKFRQCYQRGLDSDPSMSGKVVVTAKVAVSGDPLSADATTNGGLSQKVGDCVASHLRRATFGKPAQVSILHVAVTFALQKP